MAKDTSNDAAAQAAADKEAAEKITAEAAAAEAAEKDAAEKEAAEKAAAEKEAADAANAEEPKEPSLEESCEELGLAIVDGNVDLEMLTGLSGPVIGLVKGDHHNCDAAEAVRLVRAGFAKPRA